MAFSVSPNGNMAIGNYQEKETYSVYKNRDRSLTLIKHQRKKRVSGVPTKSIYIKIML